MVHDLKSYEKICFVGDILLSGRKVGGRDCALEIIAETVGLDCVQSVSSRCDLVVTDCPDMVTPYKGIQKAREMGITVISSYEFFESVHALWGEMRAGDRFAWPVTYHTQQGEWLWKEMDGTYGRC